MQFYSVGHSNRTADELVGLLRGAGVAALADVRRIPASGRNPEFGRRAVDAALAGAGIAYPWLSAPVRRPPPAASPSPSPGRRAP